MTDIDPRDVPILAELEEDFRRMVAAALAPPPGRTAGAAGAGVAARSPTPAPGAAEHEDSFVRRGSPARVPSHARRRRRQPRRERAPALSAGRRILGRAAVAGALVGVVGASALATKSVVRGGPGSPGPVVLERADGHEVVLRRYQGRLCLDVSYAGGVASRCTSRPTAGGVAPLSAVTAAGRVVAGVTGDGVAAVRVQRGGHGGADAPTRAVGGDGNAGLRWFSVLLPSVPRDRAKAVVVTPRPGGRAVADCSLGSVASCRAARSRAP